MELMREERARRDTGDRDARRIELAVGRERRDRNGGVLGKARRRHKREEKRAQAQSFCGETPFRHDDLRVAIAHQPVCKPLRPQEPSDEAQAKSSPCSCWPGTKSQ